MAKKDKVENIENVENEETSFDSTPISGKSRTKRVNFTSQLPTQDNSFTGSVTAHIANSDLSVSYTKDLTGIDGFISAAFLAGIRERLSTSVSGLKDVSEIFDKLTKEVTQLNLGVFSANIGANVPKDKSTPDIIIAWILLNNEDINDTDVLTKYKDAWEKRDADGKDLIRNNQRIKGLVKKLQADRMLASVGDAEIPTL